MFSTILETDGMIATIHQILAGRQIFYNGRVVRFNRDAIIAAYIQDELDPRFHEFLESEAKALIQTWKEIAAENENPTDNSIPATNL